MRVFSSFFLRSCVCEVFVLGYDSPSRPRGYITLGECLLSVSLGCFVFRLLYCVVVKPGAVSCTGILVMRLLC